MSTELKLLFASHDEGLLTHWQRAFALQEHVIAKIFETLHLQSIMPGTLIWIDLALPQIPPWKTTTWKQLISKDGVRVVATSSNPSERQAIEALDAGCAGYCHAFSDAQTLIQVFQVVQSGYVWIGKTLMQRLIQSAGRAISEAQNSSPDWGHSLTQREREIAILAANGATNQAIAVDCSITERTVKAHLSAVFEKLNVSDRLQLALRVHGIQ
ncbi:MAG: response regulator transcription factor [Rhodoferax sp.]|nr:response regulator transcription factor [Rhodoferax sp.]